MKNKINDFFNWIKKWTIKGFDLFKDWFKKTAIPFLKTNWMQIVNMIILFIVYDTVSGAEVYPWTETFLGLWLFVLIVYYLFWKLLGAEKLFEK